jgi:hypothetical protein
MTTALLPAPFFSLVHGAWIPYVCAWDPETGAFCGVEGPREFASYREAVEASRFLMLEKRVDVTYRLQ